MFFKLIIFTYLMLGIFFQAYSKSLSISNERLTYPLKKHVEVFKKEKQLLTIEQLIRNGDDKNILRIENISSSKKEEHHWFRLKVNNVSNKKKASFFIFDNKNKKIIPVYYKINGNFIKNSLEPFLTGLNKETIIYFKSSASLVFNNDLTLDHKEFFLSRRNMENFFSTLFFSFLIILLIFSIVLMFFVKKKNNFYLSLGYLFSLILYLFFSNLFLNSFTNFKRSDFLNNVHSLSFSFVILFTFILSLNYLKIKKESKYFKIILSTGIFAVFLGFSSFFIEIYSREINTSLYILLNLFFIFLGIDGFDKNSRSSTIFTAFLGVILIGSLLNFVRSLGLLNPNLFFDNAIYISQVLSSALIFCLLVLEVNNFIEKENQIKFDNAESKLNTEKKNIEILNTQLKKEKNETNSLKDNLFHKISEIDSILEISGKAFL